MATNANELALTLDEEGLPTYTQIESNAVQDNLKESKHKRSYFISFMIWASIAAIIIILILADCITTHTIFLRSLYLGKSLYCVVLLIVMNVANHQQITQITVF